MFKIKKIIKKYKLEASSRRVVTVERNCPMLNNTSSNISGQR